MTKKTDRRTHYAKIFLRALATGNRQDFECSTNGLAKYGIQIRKCHATGLVTSWSRAYQAKQAEAVQLFEQVFEAHDSGNGNQRAFLRGRLRRLGVEIEFESLPDGKEKPPAPKTFSRADKFMYGVIARSRS